MRHAVREILFVLHKSASDKILYFTNTTFSLHSGTMLEIKQSSRNSASTCSGLKILSREYLHLSVTSLAIWVTFRSPVLNNLLVANPACKFSNEPHSCRGANTIPSHPTRHPHKHSRWVMTDNTHPFAEDVTVSSAADIPWAWPRSTDVMSALPEPCGRFNPRRGEGRGRRCAEPVTGCQSHR